MPLSQCRLAQVEELLQLDASNEEYQELAKSLAEVIELTEDLLREASQPTAAAAPSQPGTDTHRAWSSIACQVPRRSTSADASSTSLL